jgi:uncharacterized protein YbjT (DUF2867 family)
LSSPVLLPMQSVNVFVTGGTGYMGQRLIPALIARGHRVDALVRPGSERKLPSGVTPIVGNVLERGSFESAICAGSVVVHLVGTPHPSPSKATQFEAVDFVSARECIAAAQSARARHFVYVSVAHPAPVMHAYVDVRIRAEALLRESGLAHTVLRPWYVLGPGHRWAYALLPVYWLLGALPSTRDGARRLGMVTLEQMVGALVWAIETASLGAKVMEVPDIREKGLKTLRLPKTTA